MRCVRRRQTWQICSAVVPAVNTTELAWLRAQKFESGFLLRRAIQEIERLTRLSAAVKPRVTEFFMNAPSPGIVATTMLNAHYASHEAYLDAVAREIRTEYLAVIKAGFVLQIDAPDLAMERVLLFQDMSDMEYAKVEQHVAALNKALEGIPADRVRLHVCWGNWEGPHVRDVAMEVILRALHQANVGALGLEFANPRRQHESARCANTIGVGQYQHDLSEHKLSRSLEECLPRSLRQRCLAHKMRNLQGKVPEDVWPEFKARATACYQAVSPALAHLLRDDIAATYPAMTGLDPFAACLNSRPNWRVVSGRRFLRAGNRAGQPGGEGTIKNSGSTPCTTH